MDEKKFFDYMDAKHAEIMEGLAKILDMVGIKLTTIKFADHSTKPNRESSGKKMPTIIGNFTIADKGCNRCGGKITWDNYDKETQPYPDHVDEDGNLMDCPEYK